ncbi:MAG: B12-binding domain-containing radical SAM protein, partial [Anaerolineae bacterium]
MPVDERTLDRWLPTVGKPARYTGNEWNAVQKPWDEATARMVLAYPDVYEVGMSNIGLQVLYDIVNRRSDALCERAFAPWPDMEARMREQGIPLYALESRRALSEFDLIGFSLPYELNTTNVLNMLDLGGLPVRAADRAADHGGKRYPLVIAGGSGAAHPEPMADFIDAFVVGDGEEVILEVLAVVAAAHKRDLGRKPMLR